MHYIISFYFYLITNQQYKMSYTVISNMLPNITIPTSFELADTEINSISSNLINLSKKPKISNCMKRNAYFNDNKYFTNINYQNLINCKEEVLNVIKFCTNRQYIVLSVDSINSFQDMYLDFDKIDRIYYWYHSKKERIYALLGRMIIDNEYIYFYSECCLDDRCLYSKVFYTKNINIFLFIYIKEAIGINKKFDFSDSEKLYCGDENFLKSENHTVISKDYEKKIMNIKKHF